MDPWLERAGKSLRATPPKCLEGSNAIPANPGPAWDGFAYWSLRCPCGSRNGRVLGYSLAKLLPSYKGRERFCSPLGFHCDACGQEIEIIDTDKHGYDAVLAKPMERRGTGPRDEFECFNCGSKSFSLVVAFGHGAPDDADTPKGRGLTKRDLFDAFTCLGTCKLCAMDSWIAEYELA